MTVLVTFFIEVTKILNKSDVMKGFELQFEGTVHHDSEDMTRKYEAAACTTSAAGKQRKRNAEAQLFKEVLALSS